MKELLDAATALAVLLPARRIELIAERIVSSRAYGSDVDLRSLVVTAPARAVLEHLLTEWATADVSGEMVAGILRGACHGHAKARNESSVDLVWTGPTTSFVAMRRTEQVLLDLIRHAEMDLFMVSFVAYDVKSVVAELNAAVGRGIDVKILVESSSAHGGSLNVDPVATMRTHVPGAVLYAWLERGHPFQDGRVHAKVAVADGRAAFITSANLTGHALEKNMEAGVVIEGGRIPSTLRSHLHALIDTKILRRV